MKQVFLFLAERKGTGKESGRAYHNVELHDPESLTNGTFNADSLGDLSHIQARSKVECEVGFRFDGYRHTVVIKSLKSIV